MVRCHCIDERTVIVDSVTEAASGSNLAHTVSDVVNSKVRTSLHLPSFWQREVAVVAN